MKIPFVISNLGITKIEKMTFFACQYTAILNGYDFRNNMVAPFARKDKKSMDSAVNFIQEKYEKYIPILAKRLNVIHNTDYSDKFWKRSLSQGFIMQITLHHDIYDKCSKNFNPEIHTCNILSKSSYVVPKNFEEHRELFECSNFGQEQLFSLYIESNFQNHYKKIDYKYKINNSNENNINYKNYLKKLLIKLRKNILYPKKNLNNANVILLGTFFSKKEEKEIITRGNGYIQKIPIDEIEIQNDILNSDARKILSSVENNFDDFDKYFFRSLEYTFPQFFIENFSFFHKEIVNQQKKFINLKYIISEAWLSNTWINLFLALANEIKGVQHYYNEHNCIFHPYTGNMVINQSKLVDKYITFGWIPNNKNSNFIRAASLYQFKGIRKSKNINILYISYPAAAKMPNYGGPYSTNDYGAINHLNFVDIFFRNLKNDVLEKISYRPYPKDAYLVGLLYDKEIYLSKYLKKVKILESYKNKGILCKDLIATSQIVIVDFLSTAYLEALMMNKPTICFFDKNSMHLEDEYCNYFDQLINAQIMHSSPEEAANHLNSINSNPDKWWHSDHTQMLKDEWLSSNFGSPNLLVDLIVNLSKKHY